MVKSNSQLCINTWAIGGFLQCTVPTQFRFQCTYCTLSTVNTAGNLEWETRKEGTEGCFSVHAKGNCASIQLTNNIQQEWYSTSCVTVVYIWDPSFSITPVGAMPCIRNMVGTFVQAGAIGGEYGMDDVIFL